MQANKVCGFVCVAMMAVFARTSPAFADGEIEANNSCQQAQTLRGFPNISAQITSQDVDFFRFSGTPNQEVTIQVLGGLGQTVLGAFDSSCNSIGATSGTTGSQPPVALLVPIPADGVIIVAVGGYPDFGFNGSNYYYNTGSYSLSVVPTIGSIRGRLVDSVFNTVIPGDGPPFGQIALLRCSGQGSCSTVAQMPVDSDGTFLFSPTVQDALAAGRYALEAQANEYETVRTELFVVKAEEDFDAGDLLLDPPAYEFFDVVPCRLQPQGGVCRYSVKISNNTFDDFSGLIWSVVTGDFPNVSTVSFEANSRSGDVTSVARPLVNIPAFGETQVQFQFSLPSFTPNNAALCITLFLGIDPSPLANPARSAANLFCVTKGTRGFRVLGARESQEKFKALQAPALRR